MSHQDAIKPRQCVFCGELPEVESFEVNPMFGGGTAYEAKCVCGAHEGVEYRTEDDAINGWNAYMDQLEDDLDWRKIHDEAMRAWFEYDEWDW